MALFVVVYLYLSNHVFARISFRTFEKYKAGEGNGDPNCPGNHVTKDKPPLKLGYWLTDQRRAKRGSCKSKHKISDDHMHRLEELGVWWEQPDTWEEYFSALVRYKAGDGNGDPNCTRNYVTKDTPPLKLGSWLHCQRSGRKGTRKRKLSVEQIRRLEELGVWWNRNNKGGTPQNLIYE